MNNFVVFLSMYNYVLYDIKQCTSSIRNHKYKKLNVFLFDFIILMF